MNDQTIEQHSAIEEEAIRAGVKEWLGLAVLMLPTILLALDFTVLHLALPHLAIDLQASSTQQLWILDIYGFMIAGFLVTMGTVGDRIGRRRLLMIGASAFGVASIVAAFSFSTEMLIVTRALLGVAGATLMPSTLSLISHMFKNAKQRTVAISLWMMSFSGGAVLGPAVGGVLLQFFWWGSVFLMAVPVMVLLLIVAPFLLPEQRHPNAGKVDLLSVVLSLFAILFIIYGIKHFASNGWNVTAFLWIVIGAGVGWMFVKRQLILRDPLLELKLFNNKRFSGSLSMMLVGAIVQGGFVLLFAQYLQMVVQMTPIEAGIWMTFLSVGSIIGSLIAPVLIRWTSRFGAIAIGLIISAVACLLIIFLEVDSSIAYSIMISVLLTTGFGPLFVLTTDLVIGFAPPEKSGSAASLSETSGELGMALGVAIIGSIATALYRFHIDLPGTVPEELAQLAQDTIAGAVGTMDLLPSGVAASLLAQAQASFMTAFQTVGGISLAILVGLIFVTLTLFRQVKS